LSSSRDALEAPLPKGSGYYSLRSMWGSGASLSPHLLPVSSRTNRRAEPGTLYGLPQWPSWHFHCSPLTRKAHLTIPTGSCLCMISPSPRAVPMGGQMLASPHFWGCTQEGPQPSFTEAPWKGAPPVRLQLPGVPQLPRGPAASPGQSGESLEKWLGARCHTLAFVAYGKLWGPSQRGHLDPHLHASEVLMCLQPPSSALSQHEWITMQKQIHVNQGLGIHTQAKFSHI
jgi:hypothetical protein